MLGLSLKWVYEPKSEYISRNKMKKTTRVKIHIKCDCRDVTVLNAFREPTVHSFTPSKLPVVKLSSELETKFKKNNMFCVV